MALTGRKCNLKEADAYVLLLNIIFDLIINCQWWRSRSCSVPLWFWGFAIDKNHPQESCLSGMSIPGMISKIFPLVSYLDIPLFELDKGVSAVGNALGLDLWSWFLLTHEAFWTSLCQSFSAIGVLWNTKGKTQVSCPELLGGRLGCNCGY